MPGPDDWLPDTGVYIEVHQERLRAHSKHGAAGNSRERSVWNDSEWLPILVEEVGEVAHELTYDTLNSSKVMQAMAMRKELIQVAAMSAAWIDSIDRFLARAVRQLGEPMPELSGLSPEDKP